MVEQTNSNKGGLAIDIHDAMKTIPICKKPFYAMTEFNVNELPKWFKMRTVDGAFKIGKLLLITFINNNFI